MAYGNWGAFVRKNGERMKEWEDATPYKEKEFESGYYQAFARGLNKELDPHHAVLGDKKMRLCGYKNYPVLFFDGIKIDIEQYVVKDENYDETDYEHDYKGKIEDYEFTTTQYNDNMVDLYLKEPDGTVWTATCGYCYGAGHMD